MPFTIEEFHDLVRLLEQHPEWSAELRRLVLSQELLTLPELVKGLAELQRRTEERLEELGARVTALAEAQQRTEERLEELGARVTALAEAQQRTEARLEELSARVTALAEAQQRTEARLEELSARVTALAEAQQRTEERLEALGVMASKMRQDLDALLGIDLERRYRERAASYFQRFLRRIRVVDHEALALRLDDAVDAGTITADEKEEILLLDVVVQGQRDQQDAYLAVEVSSTIDTDDVQRAVSRAALLRKVTGRPVIPAVAGRQLHTIAADEAAKRSVVCFLDGRIVVAP
ncbi:MAG TPA: hypothetical protein VNJ11_09730 [Bryobacteraceae bacterium]|nr:hypothetical protein [Bryobacteraceae bacterium]